MDSLRQQPKSPEIPHGIREILPAGIHTFNLLHVAAITIHTCQLSLNLFQLTVKQLPHPKMALRVQFESDFAPFFKGFIHTCYH